MKKINLQAKKLQSRQLPTIQSIKNIKGKHILVRVDFNVPTKFHQVVDDFRITRSLLTIEYLKKKGAKVILLSHIGYDGKESLRAVANHFNRKLNIKVGFVPDIENPATKTIVNNMSDGSVVLFQNLRRYPGETTNNATFAKKLASFGDIYVNDAFSVSHRKHASIVGIPKYLPSYAGILFQEEVKHLSMAQQPKHPFLFILGGAKIATKLPLLKKFLKIADKVFVGGVLANNLLRKKGISVGKSRVDTQVKNLNKLIQQKNLILPYDVLIANQKNGEVRSLKNISPREIIVDVGPRTRKSFQDLISKHKFILMNGPLGNYEDGYSKGTKKILSVLSKSKAKVIVGGGDTVTLVSAMKLEKGFLFVSTGGGAMLDYLIDGKLPGIDTLLESNNKQP